MVEPETKRQRTEAEADQAEPPSPSASHSSGDDDDDDDDVIEVDEGVDGPTILTSALDELRSGSRSTAQV